MSMPSPFEIGRAIGNNISGAFQQQRDTSAIDDILKQASESKDPDAMNNVMRQLLSKVSPERQQLALQLLQPKINQFSEQAKAAKTRQAYKNLGLDPSIADLDPALQKEFVKNNTKSKPNVSGALAAIDQLENLIPKEGVGLLGQLNPSSKARFNRGEFESTLAAVLPVFKSLFPRGMTEKEFLRVMHDFLPTANDSEQNIRGKLQGLRNLVQNQNGVTQLQYSAMQNNQTVPMQDAQGNFYDIPANLVEQAKAQGLK